MGLRFSKLTFTVNGEPKECYVGGFPQCQDDLEPWESFRNIVRNYRYFIALIPVHVEAFIFDDGNPVERTSWDDDRNQSVKYYIYEDVTATPAEVESIIRRNEYDEMSGHKNFWKQYVKQIGETAFIVEVPAGGLKIYKGPHAKSRHGFLRPEDEEHYYDDMYWEVYDHPNKELNYWELEALVEEGMLWKNEAGEYMIDWFDPEINGHRKTTLAEYAEYKRTHE